MELITITDDYLTDVRERFEKWADFLNMGFGLVAFTFALACLGTKTPVVNAWFCIAVLTFVRYKGRHLFPAEIVRLRKLAKVDEKSRVVLRGLESEFLGMKAAVTASRLSPPRISASPASSQAAWPPSASRRSLPAKF